MLFPSIYLASQSPRRAQLLKQIGVDFTILSVPSDDFGDIIDETPYPLEKPFEYVCRMAKTKAQVAYNYLLSQKQTIKPVLTADTTVALNDQILGKPQNLSQAIEMITLLSGKTHQVLTSVAISHKGEIKQLTNVSQVTFSELSPKDIQSYCQTSEPYDKAGGYGIQGHAACFISHINGSFSSIMGLPLFETSCLLRSLGEM